MSMLSEMNMTLIVSRIIFMVDMLHVPNALGPIRRSRVDADFGTTSSHQHR